jgi:hypothetical protein
MKIKQARSTLIALSEMQRRCGSVEVADMLVAFEQSLKDWDHIDVSTFAQLVASPMPNTSERHKVNTLGH